MRFVGWVPTVTGHLSFTTLATGSFPTRCWRRERGDRLIALQRRDLLDVLVPYADSVEVVSYFREKLANIVIGISGRFWYVLDAREVDDGECLEGHIYMIPAAKNGDYIGALHSWLTSSVDLEGVDEFIAKTTDVSCYSVEFRLERGGKASLTPSSSGEGEQLRRLLANQAFFFLKDICHVHQHHHPTHDAITEVAEIKSDDREPDWIAQTQYSLYRAIIRFKRFKNEKALFRAAGILAYARSFDRSYGKENSFSKKFNVDELKESLAIGREELRHFQGRSLSFSETLRNTFFAAFGLVAAAGIYARLGGKQDFDVDDSIITIAQYVASNPWKTAAFTFIASFLWAFRTHRIDASEFVFVRWVLRSVQGLRLRYAFLVHVAATFVFMLLCYLLLAPLD